MMRPITDIRRQVGALGIIALASVLTLPMSLAGQNSGELAPGTASTDRPPASLLSPEARGLEIAREADQRDTGFGDFTATLSMVLRNRHGEESTRQMRMKTLEVEGDGDKMLVIFDEPRDVSGTALLSFAHRTGSDDQWFYLPALRRVKRIASNNKAGPFMGSEFAYEDFSSQEVEKYTYRFLDEDQLDGTPTWCVERYPLDPASGYTRQIVWFDQEEYRVLKVDYYDRRDELLKTLTMHDYQQFAAQFWRSGRMEMVNHQTGKSTTLLFGDYAFGTGLTDRDFDTNSLRRAR
jgi:outer membrane lipoprotein-sorting protein